MKIGDVVKLKNIIENRQSWLRSYKDTPGVIIDFQRRFNNSAPIQTVRVFFAKMEVYEDLAAWRVTKA